MGRGMAHLLHNYFPPIDVDEIEKMSRPIATCEIVAALKSMKPYKAPGPEGFQPIFSAIPKDLRAVLLEDQSGVSWPKLVSELDRHGSLEESS